MAELTPASSPVSAGSGPWRSYKERVAQLAERIVEAQKPIRVLNALKWKPGVFEHFRSSGFREMPRVGKDEYDPPDFDTQAKIAEFRRSPGTSPASSASRTTSLGSSPAPPTSTQRSSR